MKPKLFRVLEILFLVAGMALMAFYGAARLDGFLASRAAIHDFRVARSRSLPKTVSFPARLTWSEAVDFSLWAPGRIRAYRQSLAADHPLPLAILRIPRIHLTVPVFNGTDALTLNRGVGRIEGTALPGGPGNLGIAGHRDGFFRGLKDVSRGDVVDLATPDGTDSYVIDRIEIVSPGDVGVLSPRARPSLTLVTCYPFYYLGSAPKRYVVEASLRSEIQTGDRRSPPSHGDAKQGGTGR